VPRLQVDALDLGQEHADVLLFAHDGSDRNSDLARRQARHRDLVEQRLKQVVVLPVDQGDVDIGLGQRTSTRQAAESTAYDHNMFTLAHGAHLTPTLSLHPHFGRDARVTRRLRPRFLCFGEVRYPPLARPQP
jgi:hypothetical protein